MNVFDMCRYFYTLSEEKNLRIQNANVLVYFRHKARNLNEYLHVYPSHSLGKKTTGFSETIQDNYTPLKKETFTSS